MARPKEFDRDTALAAAMRTFWAKGYDGTSVADLTAAMGLSRSSLYETFGDKEALFKAALSNYLELTAGKRSAALAGAGSVREGMAALLRGVVNFLLADDQPGGCFFTNTATALGTLAEPVQEMIGRHIEQMEDDFRRFFERGQARGEIASAKDPRALARFFVGAIRGMTVFARVRKDRRALEDIATVALTVLD